MNKDVQQLIKQLREVEGVIVDQSGPHPRVYKDGKFVVALPSTPSGHIWRKTKLSVLAKAGIKLNGESERKEVTVTTQTVEDPRYTQTEPFAPYLHGSMLQTEASKNGGIERLTVASAERLRRAFKAFLNERWDEHPVVRFTRYLWDFQGRPAWSGFEYKTYNSAEVSMRNFLNGKNGLSTDAALLLVGAMNAYRKNPEPELTLPKADLSNVKQPEKYTPKPKQEKPEPKPIEEPVVEAPKRRKMTYRVVPETNPFDPRSPEHPLWESLLTQLQLTQKEFGNIATTRYAFGKGTAKQLGYRIVKQAKDEGVELRPGSNNEKIDAVTVGRRIMEYVKHRVREGRTWNTTPWLRHELELYADLAARSRANEDKVAMAIRPEPTVVSYDPSDFQKVPKNQDAATISIDGDEVWGEFIMLLNTNPKLASIDRTLLEEALTIAKQIVRFRAI